MKKIITIFLLLILIILTVGCNINTPNSNKKNIEEELAMPWDITGEYFLSYAHNPLEKNEKNKFDKTDAPKILYIDRKDRETEVGNMECYVLRFDDFETEQLEPIIKAANLDDKKELYVEFKTTVKNNKISSGYDVKITIQKQNILNYSITDKEGNLVKSYEFRKTKIRTGAYKYYNDAIKDAVYPLFITEENHKYNIKFLNRYKTEDFIKNFDFDNDIPIENGIVYKDIKLKDDLKEYDDVSMDLFLSNPLNLYNTAEIKFYKNGRKSEPEIYFLYSDLDKLAVDLDYMGEYHKDDEHSTAENIIVYKNSLEIDGRYTLDFDMEDLFMGWKPLTLTDKETNETSQAKISVYFDDKKEYFSVYSVNGDYDIYARGERKLK